MQRELNKLVRDETKHIKVVTTSEASEAAKTSIKPIPEPPDYFAAGGRVGMARGGRFPGDSKKDSLLAMVRPGEGFVRNEALKVWDRLFGTSFFEGVNNPWSAAGKAIINALKGHVQLPRIPKTVNTTMRFAEGGRAPSAGEVITLNLRAGGVEMPLRVMGSRRGSTRDQVREFDAELKKMGLARG